MYQQTNTGLNPKNGLCSGIYGVIQTQDTHSGGFTLFSKDNYPKPGTYVPGRNKGLTKMNIYDLNKGFKVPPLWFSHDGWVNAISTKDANTGISKGQISLTDPDWCKSGNLNNCCQVYDNVTGYKSFSDLINVGDAYCTMSTTDEDGRVRVEWGRFDEGICTTNDPNCKKDYCTGLEDCCVPDLCIDGKCVTPDAFRIPASCIYKDCNYKLNGLDDPACCPGTYCDPIQNYCRAP